MRSIASEQSLARRIAFERERRIPPMTYEGLASRMTNAGCAIQPSGIYKIEKAGRRITVDELVAFAQVFGVPVEHLLLPPELVAADEVAEIVTAWSRAQEAAISAQQEEEEAWGRVRAWFEQHPEFADKAAPIMRRWSEQHFEDDHDFRVAHKMWELTSDPEWGQQAKRALDALVGEGRV
jgi:transcriptional regulator with XRE-family HTH domain